MLALDVDPRNGGDRTLDELVRNHGALGDTLRALTGGGGVHYFFKLPPGPHVARIGLGLDVKGRGGYVVAPPSRHVSGRAYHWPSGGCDVPVLAPPEWLRRLLLKPQHERPPSTSYAPNAVRCTGPAVRTRASAYLAAMPPAISGEGGSVATMRAAVALVQGFCLPSDVALDMLLREYNPRCVPPWSRAELAHRSRAPCARRAWAMAVIAELDDAGVTRLKLALDEAKVRGGNALVDQARKLWKKKRGAARAKAAGDTERWRQGLRRDLRTWQIRPSLGNVILLLENKYTGGFTFDEMACVACLDDKPVDDAVVTDVRRDLERTENAEWSRENVAEAIQRVARQRPFHPVRRYLRSLTWDRVPRLDRIAAELLGATDALSSTLIRRAHIAAVARAMGPGCKVDTVLVLVGDEGLKKSTFFRILGRPWFSDSNVDINDRKGVMVMHSAWIYEWPEIDRMLDRKHDSDVKPFVTQQYDRFIPPYGRAPVNLARSNVVVGTTNKERSITSDTGSRSWHVVTVRKIIDGERLRAERDQIWAEAVAMYDAFVKAEQDPQTRGDANPYRWWLTKAEDDERAERNDEHLTESTSVEAADAWLRGEPIACPTCWGNVLPRPRRAVDAADRHLHRRSGRAHADLQGDERDSRFDHRVRRQFQRGLQLTRAATRKISVSPRKDSARARGDPRLEPQRAIGTLLAVTRTGGRRSR